MSGSMSSKIERAREAVIEFFKTANPQDEFFMITFADKPEEISDFTTSVEDIQGKLIYTVPKGRTALLDAIYLGVSKMRQAKYPKKALLIISDGGDNHSRYTEGEIKSMVKEADVLIYAIGIYDHYFPTEEERLGPALLSDVTELTGGRAFTIDNPNDLADVATKIGIELRNQYVLGYRPKNPGHDGKWRKIKVKLIPPKDCRRCGFTPKRVTMRLRNNVALLIFIFLTTLVPGCSSHAQGPGAPNPAQPPQPQSASSAALSRIHRRPASRLQRLPSAAQSPDSGDSGVFVFKRKWKKSCCTPPSGRQAAHGHQPGQRRLHRLRGWAAADHYLVSPRRYSGRHGHRDRQLRLHAGEAGKGEQGALNLVRVPNPER